LLTQINKLPRRTAQQVPARRPGITTGFSQARSCHTTALINQPHEAYNPVGIHQMAQPRTRPVNKPTIHLSIRKD